MQFPDREPERSDTERASGTERHEVRGRDRCYQLSNEELSSLKTVGTFRTVNAKDLPERHQKHLIDAGLMEKRSFPQRDWSRLDVVVLTREGERVLAGQQRPDDLQRFHSGLVKIRELEHDAAIYPAYRDAAEAIERAGGKVERVVLDYEFKSMINAEMNRGGSVSGAAKDERRAQLAKELDLEEVNGKLPLPDLRIEYRDEDGKLRHEDIEVVSRHYHGSHLAGKTAAGFKLVGHKGGSGAPVPEYHRKGLI